MEEYANIGSAVSTEWITIATFGHEMDTVVVGSRLREEGIVFRLLDASIVQVAPYLSSAVGGVRLQVNLRDHYLAGEVLRACGVDIEAPQIGSPLLRWFDERSKNLPLLGGVEQGRRLLLVSSMVLLTLGGAWYFWSRFAKVDLREQLTGREWCVRSMLLEGKEIKPSSIHNGFHVTYRDCEEIVVFTWTGHVKLPGVNSAPVHARWSEVDGYVEIYSADTLADIYEGIYSVSVSPHTIALRSERLLMDGDRLEYSMPF